jgi:hypothetical protein
MASLSEGNVLGFKGKTFLKIPCSELKYFEYNYKDHDNLFSVIS